MPTKEPLIGRERERATLHSLLAQARAGVGAIVLLAGEAGVGKTTLARSVLADSGLEVVKGFGVQDGASAYGPIVEALRAVLRSHARADVIDPSFASHLAVLLPELGPAAPAVDRPTLFAAIRATLARAAAGGPLAVFLDDLQWADDATLDLLPALARSLDAAPVLLLAAYRSDDVPRGHPLRRLRSELRRDRRLREIALEPFDATATAALLEQVLGAPPAPSLRDAILARTYGVPFFATELGAALATSERLRDGPAGLELLAGAELPLPDSVRDAVLLRAAGLSDAARAALAAAAVAGQSFELDSVMAIAGIDDWPDEPVRRGILVDGAPGQMAFRHALVRDAFHDEIPWLARRALHRQVAERLEAGTAPARIVAEHWAQAREPERARRSFLTAADAFCAVHAYVDGARVARRALELWPDGEDERGRLAAWSAWPGARSWAARPARSCGPGARWPRGAAARAIRFRPARRCAGSRARSRSRAAGARRWRPARTRPRRSRRPARPGTPPPSGSRPPRTCAPPPASARRCT